MYNWSDYISQANIEAFKDEYGITKFQYDIYDNNEELIAKLQGGATGYDIAVADRRVRARRWSRQGFLQKLDLSKIPNVANISPTFKNLWWDPTNEYQVPKDYGTTGVLYRSTLIPSVPKSWKEFYDLVKGPASGKTVFVDSMGDVFVFPLKMLGYSLNSVDPKELDEARTILLDVAPHLLALDSEQVRPEDGRRRGGPDAGLDRPAGTGAEGHARQGLRGAPSEGTPVLARHLGDARRTRPIRTASYAWLDFIHRPGVQGEEIELQLLRDAERRAPSRSSSRSSSRTRRSSRPTT